MPLPQDTTPLLLACAGAAVCFGAWYACAFGVRGVLLVDADGGRIHRVTFPRHRVRWKGA